MDSIQFNHQFNHRFNYLAKHQFKRRAQSGQAVIEYIILLSIVMGIMVVFIHKLTDGLDTTTAGLGGQIEKQLRTGSAPPTVWTK